MAIVEVRTYANGELVNRRFEKKLFAKENQILYREIIPKTDFDDLKNASPEQLENIRKLEERIKQSEMRKGKRDD